MPVTGGQENDVGGVVEGATNREAAARLLLSRHTNDFHLTHCLRGQAHAPAW
jgi:hypothetical protein